MSTFKVVRTVGLLLFAAYFALPMLSMLDFSTRARGDAGGRTWDAYRALVENEDLREAIIASALLAVLTVALMVVLLVPTMVWVRLRVPGAIRNRLRPTRPYDPTPAKRSEPTCRVIQSAYRLIQSCRNLRLSGGPISPVASNSPSLAWMNASGCPMVGTSR